MSEWNYFAAGILLMIALDAGWLFIRLYKRNQIQDRRLIVQKQDIESLQYEVSELTRRMDIVNGAKKRGKDHMAWNFRAGVEHQALELADVLSQLDAMRDRVETILGGEIKLRQGIFDPEKPIKEYTRKEDNL